MDTSVIQILRESQAMLSGHFLLSSGNHSNQYFQCAKLLQYPDRSAQVLAVAVAALLVKKEEGLIGFDCVCGPAMGGVIVAYELGRQLGVPAIFTERDDNNEMTLRRGFEVLPGQKIILAEDVITTGKSTLEAAAVLQSKGAEIVASVCVVDRRAQDATNPFSWPIFAALRQPAVIWEPGECSLCKEGKVPAIKPGSRKL